MRLIDIVKRCIGDELLERFEHQGCFVFDAVALAPNQMALLSCGYVYNTQFNMVLFIYYSLYFLHYSCSTWNDDESCQHECRPTDFHSPC